MSRHDRPSRLDLGADWMADEWTSTPLDTDTPRRHTMTPVLAIIRAEQSRLADERRVAKRLGEMTSGQLTDLIALHGLTKCGAASILGCSPSQMTSYLRSGPVPGWRAQRLMDAVGGVAPEMTPHAELTALVRAHGVGEAQLAYAIGVHAGAIQSWLSGRVPMTPSRLAQIRAALEAMT